MAKDHGPSVKSDKQYEGLRKKGMSKSRAAAISNSPGSSSRGGKSSGSSRSRRSSGSRARLAHALLTKALVLFVVFHAGTMILGHHAPPIARSRCI